MSQPSLFDPPTARASDPETSHQAAADVLPHVPTDRLKALRALKMAGEWGMTDFDLSAYVHVPQTSIGVRRGELVKQGLVERSVVDGKAQRRPAPSGSMAAVWMITEAGVEFLHGSSGRPA